MSLYFQWGGCFAALLVEGPWCNPWISGEPNHLENNFPGSSERNRKRTTPSEILNDAIDEKNPPLVCRIPSAVSIVWWLLCSSAKVYLYISHLPWICSRKFGNSSKNTSYQMMIKHGDQIHKRIPKNSTLRQKTRHQGTEQGGEYRFKYHPQKTPWSLIKNEEGATRIKWYYYTLLPFLPDDFLKTVPWCSLCQRVFGMECCLSQALPWITLFFFVFYQPIPTDWWHISFTNPLKSPDHRSTCPTMRHSLGSCEGDEVFFLRSNHQSWQMILHSFNIFHHFSFVILFFFLRRFCMETFLTQYVGSIKTTTWRIFHLPKSPNAWWVPTNPTQQLGPVQIPMRNFD